MNNFAIVGEKEILGHTVRVFQGQGDEFFVLARDVAEWIGHSDVTMMLQSIDIDEKIKIKLPPKHSLEGLQANTEYWFLNEDGLYEVLMLSRKPIAKAFKKGVKRLLHDLRTGKARISRPLSDDELVFAGYEVLRKRVASQQQVIDAQRTQLIEAAPKIDFYDAFKKNDAVCTFQELANVLHNNGVNIGQNRLFRDFRKAGDICKNKPLFKQKALDRKIGQNIQSGFRMSRGVWRPTFRAHLTLKGIREVFDMYNLTQAQRQAVMADLKDLKGKEEAERPSGQDELFLLESDGVIPDTKEPVPFQKNAKKSTGSTKLRERFL